MQSVISLFTTYLPYFVLVLTLLVFIHEFGHYWVARRFGIHAEVFSIGFGPELFGWTDRNGTRWKVSAIPLGGYVKFLGDNDATSATPSEAACRPSSEARLLLAASLCTCRGRAGRAGGESAVRGPRADRRVLHRRRAVFAGHGRGPGRRSGRQGGTANRR